MWSLGFYRSNTFCNFLVPYLEMRGNWNPCRLLVEVETDATIWRNQEIRTKSGIWIYNLGKVDNKRTLNDGDDDVTVGFSGLD